jgi:hypothetical protein
MMNDRDHGRELSITALVWMVSAAALHFPIRGFVINWNINRQPLVYIAIFVAFAVIVAAGVLVIDSLGVVHRSTLTYGAMILLGLFWTGGRFTSEFGPVLGLAAGVALWCVAVLIIWRLRANQTLHMLFFGLAFYLTLAPALMDLEVGEGLGDPGVAHASTVAIESALYRPDVYVVIVDGYPGIQTLAGYEEWDGEIVDELQRRGFRVAPAWSAYTTTALSMSGLLDGSYPVRPVNGLASVARPIGQFVTDGEAAVFGFLEEAGYHLTMLESPWSSYRCGPTVDSCVEAPVLDEVLFSVLEKSYASLVLDHAVGSAWIHGARRTWDWLGENAANLAANGRPDFVLAHVIAPHEPWLLNENCDLRHRSDFDDPNALARARAEGVSAFLGQARCVDRMMTALADEVPDEAIVLFTADHGTATLGQSAKPPHQWGPVEIRERLSTFFAMRAAEDCQPREPVVVQNLLRGVMRCIGAPGLSDLDLRMFPSSLPPQKEPLGMIDLSDKEIQEVLSAVPAG